MGEPIKLTEAELQELIATYSDAVSIGRAARELVEARKEIERLESVIEGWDQRDITD